MFFRTLATDMIKPFEDRMAAGKSLPFLFLFQKSCEKRQKNDFIKNFRYEIPRRSAE